MPILALKAAFLPHPIGRAGGEGAPVEEAVKVGEGAASVSFPSLKEVEKEEEERSNLTPCLRGEVLLGMKSRLSSLFNGLPDEDMPPIPPSPARLAKREAEEGEPSLLFSPIRSAELGGEIGR